jgi:hypothetical protein
MISPQTFCSKPMVPILDGTALPADQRIPSFAFPDFAAIWGT